MVLLLQQVHLRTGGALARRGAVTAGAHRLLGMLIQWHKESKGFKNCLSRCVDDRDAMKAEVPGAPQSRLRIGLVELLIYGTFS